MRVSSAAWLTAILWASSAAAQSVGSSRCAPGVHAAEASGAVLLPQDQIFCALLADPKEARTFASYLRGEFGTVAEPGGADTNVGAVGLGDSFGLVRWSGRRPGDGLQLDLAGGIFAQFDVGTPSIDLINADYVVGLPLTLRRGGFSTRLRLYHQSSHLGDEYLLRDGASQRENLSFESLELMFSQELSALRAYVGAEHLFRREPDSLEPRLAHAGLELRSGRAGALRLVAGADLKATEQQDWSPAVSVRAGLEVARSGASGHPTRLLAFLVELYRGPSPYGQFFQDDISYVGLGFHLGL
jgi:hypothetical protein